jgi:hypothetical protein
MKFIDIISEDDTNREENKAKMIFKAFKKGKETVYVDRVMTYRDDFIGDYTFDYDLGDIYTIVAQPKKEGTKPEKPKIFIPTIRIHCDEEPKLNDNQAIKLRLLNMVISKFKAFGVELKLHPLGFRKLDSGKWVRINPYN